MYVCVCVHTGDCVYVYICTERERETGMIMISHISNNLLCVPLCHNPLKYGIFVCVCMCVCGGEREREIPAEEVGFPSHFRLRY